MPIEQPSPAPEQREMRSFQERLRDEALHKLRDVVPEDSRAYERASLAVASFLSRTLDAATLLQRELSRSDTLPKGDPRRLSEEEQVQYYEFITQTKSLAIMLPQEVQQARMVQYEPAVQERLKDIAAQIGERETLLTKIEKARVGILQSATRDGRPLRPDEIQMLLPLADTARIIREGLQVPADLNGLVEMLDKAEAGYGKATEQVGQTLRQANNVAEIKRREAGAERITQGLPGAEFVLDTPERDIAVWRRLLVEGGEQEKMRAAYQLRERVQRFSADFLQQKAYQQFEKDARGRMEYYKLKNDASWQKYWFGLLGLGDRATTTHGEFDHVFAEVTEKMKQRFDQISTLPEAKTLETLTQVLEQMGNGQYIDGGTLDAVLNDYASLQKRTGALIADIQRWQVAENVGIVGNPAEGRPNELTQLTRVGDKKLWAYMREQSPYGVFRPRSFYDERTNRLVLLAPQPGAETTLGKTGNFLKEQGKVALIATATPLLHRLIQKVPILGRPFRKIFVRVGVPVALAEMSREGAEEAAQSVRYSEALQGAEEVIDSLDSSTKRLHPYAVRKKGNQLFQALTVAFHAANSEGDPTKIDSLLALEAHMYTNQILMAFGYPPAHELGPTIAFGEIPENASPEARAYLQARQQEREGEIMGARERLGKLKAEMETNNIRGVAGEEWTGIEHVLLENYSTMKPNDALVFIRKELGVPVGKEREAVFQLAGTCRYLNRRIAQLQEQYGDKRESIPVDDRRAIESEIKHVTALGPETIIALAKFLESNEPSTEEIAKHWYREEMPGRVGRLISGNIYEEKINNIFGAPGSRQNIGKTLLREWSLLWDWLLETKQR